MSAAVNIEVADFAAYFEKLDAAAQKKASRALRLARSRVLALYGADAAAKLAEDFRLGKPTVRRLRLFRNAKRGRVWVGGNAMSLSRYGAAEQTAAGAGVPRLGVIPGAFVVRARGGASVVFAPASAPLPGWATFSGAAWTPRGDKRALRKIAVRGPDDFRSRYGPDVAAVRAKFEAEFFKNLEK